MNYILALIFSLILIGVMGLLTLFFVVLANHKDEIWETIKFKEYGGKNDKKR
jgi:hypothetical protein